MGIFTTFFKTSKVTWSVFAVLAMLVLAVPARTARSEEVPDSDIQNKRCLTCHGQSDIAELKPEQRRQMVAAEAVTASAPLTRPELFISGDVLKDSAHKNLACVSCHADAATLPHNGKLKPVTCYSANCHAKQSDAYLHSAHATATARGEKDAPTCTTCHGGHDVKPHTDRESRTYPLNVVKMCGGCHEKHTGKTPGGLDASMQVSQYLESVHGQAVEKAGLTVSATCADCHGPHEVLPAADPNSTVNRRHVPDTCGRCHVGIVETYSKSIHGQLQSGGDKAAPVCSDCHTAHAISRVDAPEFMRDIVNECGSCHDKPKPGSREKASLYETYRESYHGQVTALGSTRAARCSDCHGAHDIKRIDDKDSPLNAANKLTTCQKCHKGADVKFASFAPHADFRNSDRYPILHYVYLYFVVMMSASFGFFGLHCLLWFGRSVIERIRKGPPARPDYSKGAIQRFTRVDRINHGLVILSFFGLALTGLPLLYSDKAWAHGLATIFGGPRGCGILHRIFAVMLIANFIIHGVGVYRRFRQNGPRKLLFGPTTMLPRWKDVKDALGMFKWFFIGGNKPRFDRWTYWEKFDYVAEVGGSGIIGLTGLFLWFPVFFSSYLPGWMFNVASIVHGFEALLAVGFIFTIHFFNAHLRLEKFPVDDVMFTGRLPEEEFKHERAVEYERLAASGELAKLRVAAPPAWYRHFAVFMGITAMAIGTTIVTLIILAALKII